jgi:hypothetical protein
MTTNLEHVTSAEGTQIAVEAVGEGRPVVLIGGAFNDRTTVAGLAQVLSPYYQAVTYDRRGRGDSGDESRDYSVDREMEDRAVIGHAGSGRRGLIALLGLAAPTERWQLARFGVSARPSRPKWQPTVRCPSGRRASAGTPGSNSPVPAR